MGTSEVLKKFIIASLAMWGMPLTILYVFNNYTKPGTIAMSQNWHTLLSGLLAVLSVNMVIAVYIVMAMREPRSKAEPEPDPVFASRARSSLQAHQTNTPLEYDKKLE